MRTSVIRGSRRQRKKAHTRRVWLNGSDVTALCQEADARRGVVLLLKGDSHDRFYVDDSGEIAREWRRGHVEIRRQGESRRKEPAWMRNLFGRIKEMGAK